MSFAMTTAMGPPKGLPSGMNDRNLISSSLPKALIVFSGVRIFLPFSGKATARNHHDRKFKASPFFNTPAAAWSEDNSRGCYHVGRVTTPPGSLLGLNPKYSAMADSGASTPLQELQTRLHAPTAWMQGVVKGAQRSVEKWGFLLQSGRRNSASRVWSVAGTKKDSQVLNSGVEAKAEASFQERLERQLAAWRRNSAWVDEVPALEVTVPRGTLCKFDSRFQLGIPPDAVYNILTDPNNKRVFRNIQEVKYRKVLEDDGNRQLVELEQLASWRFLWLSGTLSACVLVDQDRSTHMVKYRLAKTGFMKRFEGTWKIEPLFVDDSGAPVQAPESGTERVASVVTLQQLWQSVIVPPPPFGGYVRGITTKTTVEMMQELQTEAKRLREGTTSDDDNFDRQDSVVPEKVVPLVEQWKLSKRSGPGRRKSSRKNQWRIRSE